MKKGAQRKCLNKLLIVMMTVTIQVLLTTSLHAGIVQRAQASRWALIVHTAPVGADEAVALAEILEKNYGYESSQVFLLTGRVRLAHIDETMGVIYENIRANDELFVLLSMPVFESRDNVWFVPDDGNMETPWKLLELPRVLDWLYAMRFGAALLTIPNCSFITHERQPEILANMRQQYRRDGSIELMRVCNLDILRNQKESPLGPQLSVNEHLTGWMHSMLRMTADQHLGPVPLTAEGFAERAERGFANIQVDRLSGYGDSTFAFVAQPSRIVQYKVDYRKAPKDTLAAMVSRAREEGGEFEKSTIGFLQEIALDPDALLERDRDARVFRSLAVKGLALLPSESARNVLRELAINGSDGWIRRVAITEMSYLEEHRPADKEAIRQALNDEDPAVQEVAVRAVLRNGDQQAAELLSRMLTSDRETNVRLQALRAVAALQGERIRGTLLQVLEDPNADMRRGAAEALSQLGPDAATSRALINLGASDSEMAVREAAIYALGHSTPSSDRSAISEHLLELAGRADEPIQRAAAYSFGYLGGRRVEKFLIGLMADLERPEATRVTCAEALGRLKSAAALENLIHATEDPSPALRRAAVSALGEVGGDSALDVLVRSLKDEDPYVREAAQKALNQIEGSPTVTLVRSLDSPDIHVRIEAIRKLGAARDPAMAENIVWRLGDESWEVRQAAIEALAGYDPSAIAEIMERALAHENPSIRAGAAGVLGRSPAPAVPDALLEAARDKSGLVRAEAVLSLGQFDDPRAEERILAATNDEDPNVRQAAARSLKRSVDDPKVKEKLSRMAVSDPSSMVREASIHALRGYREFELKMK